MKKLNNGCIFKLRMTGYECENDVIHVVREDEEEQDVPKILKDVKTAFGSVQDPELI